MKIIDMTVTCPACGHEWDEAIISHVDTVLAERDTLRTALAAMVRGDEPPTTEEGDWSICAYCGAGGWDWRDLPHRADCAWLRGKAALAADPLLLSQED